MHAVLFSLVAVDNPNLIFAWGMEIITDEDPDTMEASRKAIVYIDLPNGKGQIATHVSAESARARWSHVVPLSIVWEGDLGAATCAQNSNSPTMAS